MTHAWMKNRGKALILILDTLCLGLDARPSYRYGPLVPSKCLPRIIYRKNYHCDGASFLMVVLL